MDFQSPRAFGSESSAAATGGSKHVGGGVGSTDEPAGNLAAYDPRNPAARSLDAIARSTIGHGSTCGAAAHAAQAGLEAVPARYARKPNGELRTDTDHAGIYLDGTGQRYLKQNKTTYPCKHDGQTWRIVQPDDRQKPGIPVKLDEHGVWRLNANVGLPAGGDEKSPRFTELTNRKRSLELDVMRSENRWRQLNAQYLDVRRRWEEAERKLQSLRPQDGHSPSDMRPYSDAIALEHQKLDLERERDMEHSKYNYARMDLRSVEDELTSLNLFTY